MVNKKSYTPNFYEEVASRADVASQICANLLKETLLIETLIDVGSGTGIWTRNFLLTIDQLKELTSIDLPTTRRIYLEDSSLDLSKIRIIEQDLVANPYLPEEIFDLTICVEVLEHLVEDAGIKLIEEFGKKTKFLLFSAAVPGQGGTHHINEQKYAYWYEKLKNSGFVPLDIMRPSLNKPEVPSYYRHNIVLWVNLNHISSSQTQILLANLFKLIDGSPRDTRNLLSIFRYKMLSLFPHQVITFLSKVRTLFSA
jgi:hypothetical protein